MPTAQAHARKCRAACEEVQHERTRWLERHARESVRSGHTIQERRTGLGRCVLGDAGAS